MKLKVSVNGTTYEVDVEVEPEQPATLNALMYGGGGARAHVVAPQAPQHVRTPANEAKGLNAPISGTVTKVLVEAGKAVAAGETLIVLEAMKMETEITAPGDGVVAEVTVKPGDAVQGGQVLLRWE